MAQFALTTLAPASGQCVVNGAGDPGSLAASVLLECSSTYYRPRESEPKLD